MVKKDRWGNVIEGPEDKSKDTNVNINVETPPAAANTSSTTVEKKVVVKEEEDDKKDDTPTPSTTS